MLCVYAKWIECKDRSLEGAGVMEKKAVLIGALDTKGHEFQFVKDTLQACGMDTFIVDTGVLGEPLFQAGCLRR